MFEYRVDTHYGVSPPSILNAPEKGFRLREIQPIETSRARSICVNYGGSQNTPYASSENETTHYTWIVTWERYTEQEST